MTICDPPLSPEWPALSPEASKNTIRETLSVQMVHFFYNLTRKETTAELNQLALLLSDLFRSLKHAYQRGEILRKEYLNYLNVLFKMVIQTRDIEMGQGERDLTYMMIYGWYQHYPLLSILLIRLIVGAMDLTEFGSDQKNRCFGSWKDIASLCRYIYDQSSSTHLEDKRFHPLITTTIEIAIHQLHRDFTALETGGKLSFVAKWIPREKSSTGRLLYDRFVYHWVQKTQPWILETADNSTRLIYAWNKSRRIFRKVLSRLNRALDTTEIKMCSGNWASISPEKINLLTFAGSRNAFLGHSVGGKEDRAVCSQKVKQHFYSATPSRTSKGGNGEWGLLQKVNYKHKRKSNPFDSGIRTFPSSTYPVKPLPFGYTSAAILPDGCSQWEALSVNESGESCDSFHRSKTSKLRNYPLSHFVKRAFELISLSADVGSLYDPWIQTQIATLNREWRYHLSFHLDLNFTVPILELPILSENVSVSSSVGSLDTIYQMIGVACFLSEKSTLDKRMMLLVHGKPTWMNLSHCMDFFSMIQEIRGVLPSFSSSFLKEDYYTPSTEGVIQSVQMILESIQNIRMSTQTSEKMMLVFLQNWGESSSSLIRRIDQQCSQFRQIHAVHKTPHIIYWNFHSKTVSPFSSLVVKERTTFFSGFSSSFIDYLCFMGTFTTVGVPSATLAIQSHSIRDSTPYETICHFLQHSHYDVYEKIFWKIVS